MRGQQVSEFKEMVKAFHRAGIEVILDVVYNHTCEGNEHGPTLSFRGLDNAIYYMLDKEGRYYNFSGCGNTLNCNHPLVRDLIIDSLTYLVAELHVDGFRFDLASILGRGPDGKVLEDPPLLQHIAEHPSLAGTKLIAEAWDAAGSVAARQIPRLGPLGRAERPVPRRRAPLHPQRRRHDGRRSSNGSAAAWTSTAARHATPYHSINFVTCHDGFTLYDLVSYNHKHNWANGEDNRDGWNDNYSYNCGHEGPTDNPHINALRQRQMRNFLTMLLISQGVPLLLQGDEFGRTQQGNNNAYCQDNEISWVDWGLAQKNAGLLRFTRMMIALRKKALRPRPGAVRQPGDLARTKGRAIRTGRAQRRALAFQLHGWQGQPDLLRDLQRPLGIRSSSRCRRMADNGAGGGWWTPNLPSPTTSSRKRTPSGSVPPTITSSPRGPRSSCLPTAELLLKPVRSETSWLPPRPPLHRAVWKSMPVGCRSAAAL